MYVCIYIYIYIHTYMSIDSYVTMSVSRRMQSIHTLHARKLFAVNGNVATLLVSQILILTHGEVIPEMVPGTWANGHENQLISIPSCSIVTNHHDVSSSYLDSSPIVRRRQQDSWPSFSALQHHVLR